MDRPITTRPSEHKLASDLRGGLDRGEMFASFQPQVDVATRDVVAVEALCRWIHPELGLLMPYAFIPVAESTGLIDDIGQFMMEEACTAAARVSAEGRELGVSVNLSPCQLEAERVFDILVSTVDRMGLPPETLTVEITESTPILDMPKAIAQLERIREHHIGVAIDDFGTGHSSLARLDHLPVTELKIDQSLVRDESGAALDRMVEVIEISHARDIRVVAEGVETEEQFARVVELGCDRAQGFLFSQSVSLRQLERLVLNER